ncbi:hypothetical protein [Zongyangia hominis]|uniref:Uncharacterized protein n=1 Tax=Zongyangia hominis TaxID=2763677 RepID=A0A926ICH8_9FIRM|nr:hypothetical protein [Zongyangia hominis]MBC8571140.1 hypothetical protein [Zongyangia hominis]
MVKIILSSSASQGGESAGFYDMSDSSQGRYTMYTIIVHNVLFVNEITKICEGGKDFPVRFIKDAQKGKKTPPGRRSGGVLNGLVIRQ